MNARPPADRLLAHLRLDREAPTLDYLHRIIREHQLRVPFETLTKLIEYEPGLRDGTLTRHSAAGAEQTRIAAEDIPGVLADIFGADPALYIDAAAVHRRYMRAPQR